MGKNIAILTGGGARGAYQAGILQKLLDDGVKFNVVIGTSVGALNAALLTKHKDALYDVWHGIEGKRQVLRYNWRGLFWKGIHDTKPLRKLIHKYLDEFVDNGRNVYVEASVVDMRTSEVHYYSNKDKDYRKWVEASCIMPFFMKPLEDRYIDGGLREVAPVNRALSFVEPGDTLYVIHAAGDISRGFQGKNILDFSTRSLDIQVDEALRNDVRLRCGEAELIQMRVRDTPLDPLDFDPEKLQEAFKIGYTQHEKI